MVHGRGHGDHAEDVTLFTNVYGNHDDHGEFLSMRRLSPYSEMFNLTTLASTLCALL